ncbi:hypothetical protein C1646_750331 [Rhizophagus diaphanus]|nr:hypothetical protein C1646_750331 [Rhizophagus diaphanus] [Rhizophagus sp. MUCL 43196]
MLPRTDTRDGCKKSLEDKETDAFLDEVHKKKSPKVYASVYQESIIVKMYSEREKFGGEKMIPRYPLEDYFKAKEIDARGIHIVPTTVMNAINIALECAITSDDIVIPHDNMPFMERDTDKAITRIIRNIENHLKGSISKTDFDILVSGGAPGIDVEGKSARLGELYRGAHGTQTTLNIEVELKELSVCYAKEQFPCVKLTDKESNSIDWMKGENVIINGASSAWGDAFVVRAIVQNNNKYILIFHQCKHHMLGMYNYYTAEDSIDTTGELHKTLKNNCLVV